MESETNFPNQMYTNIETKELERLLVANLALNHILGRIATLNELGQIQNEIFFILRGSEKPMLDWQAKWGDK